MSSTALIAPLSISSSIDGRSVAVIATTAAAAASIEAKFGDQRRRRRRRRQQPQGQLGDHAERALGADEQLGQRQPGDVLQPRAAQPHRGAVGEHDLHAEDVVGGDAVLHAAQPAGVGGRVAADRADLERRRVRRVPEPCAAAAFLTSALKAPGCATATRVTGSIVIARIRSSESVMPPSTAVEPPDRPEPAPRGTTGTRCAGGPAQHGLHVRGAVRPHHGQRRPGVGVAGPVLPVGRQHVRVGEHGVGRQRCRPARRATCPHLAPRTGANRGARAPTDRRHSSAWVTSRSRRSATRCPTAGCCWTSASLPRRRGREGRAGRRQRRRQDDAAAADRRRRAAADRQRSAAPAASASCASSSARCATRPPCRTSSSSCRRRRCARRGTRCRPPSSR